MYRTDGMMTRLMDGGNPDTVERVGLWEVSRAHVEPQGVSEEWFLSRTPFLSFTEDRARAEFYASGGEGELVAFPGRWGEDTIIFELETEGMKQDEQEGVF